MAGLYDGGVMLVVKGGAPEIYEPDLGVLEHLGPGFTVGDRLPRVGAVVEQHVFRLQVSVCDSRQY